MEADVDSMQLSTYERVEALKKMRVKRACGLSMRAALSVCPERVA